MATAQNIIDAAFRKIGMLDPKSADRTGALENLNNMISSWGLEFLNHYVSRETLTIGTTKATYTLGSGGDLDTTRPIRLIDAVLRDSDGYDYDLKVIAAGDYNDIRYKSNSLRPTEIYFLPEYPLAKVVFDCVPDAAYSVVLDLEQNFTEFAALTTTVSLPNEFKEALVYNLAIALAEDKGINVRSTVLDTALRTKELIGRLNSVNRPVKEAIIDLTRSSAFDITIGE